MAQKKLTSDNIVVNVRVRPFNARELETGEIRCIDMPSTRHVIITDDHGIPRQFEFDRAYWSADKENLYNDFCTQETLYGEIGENLIDNAMEGFNNCLFAYGQTGSGKSYSVLGDIHSEETRGLVPRVVEGLFERFKQVQLSGGKVQCQVSFLEIYGERLRDLLLDQQHDKDVKPLEVKTNPDDGSHVPGLTRQDVSSAAEALRIVEESVARRETAETAMNLVSSRSHCIFTFRMLIETKKWGVTTVIKSQTHLVDLAGSERAERTGAVGKRLAEGIAINTSLSVLSRVISALAAEADGKKAPIPPFRESKLTSVLKDSLVGNSKTVMMAALSPAMDSYEETLSTLMFAKNVKAVKTNAVDNVKSLGVGSATHMMAQIEHMTALLEGLGVNVKDSTMEHIVMADIAPPRLKLPSMATMKSTPEFVKMEKEIENLKSRVQTYIDTYGVPTEPSTGTMQLSERKVQYTPDDATKMQPYLLNMCEHPVDTALMYFLKKDTLSVVGSDNNAEIQLEGENIWPFHCALENFDDVSVQLSTIVHNRHSYEGCNLAIEKHGSGFRVVPEGSIVELSHNDIIQFTPELRFRLIIPDHSVISDESEQILAAVDQMVEKGADRTEVSQCVKSISHVHPKLLTAFLHKANRTMSLINEANDITACFVPELAYRFELGVATSMLSYTRFVPSITVRMMKKKSGANLWRHVVRSKISNKTAKLDVIAEFRLCEFIQRVNIMRGLVQRALQDGVSPTSWLLELKTRGSDPWMSCDLAKQKEWSRDTARAAQLHDDAMQRSKAELAKLQVSYSGAENQIKEIRTQCDVLKRNADEHRRDLWTKDREVQEKVAFARANREQCALELREMEKAHQEKAALLEKLLEREQEEKSQAQVALQAERAARSEKLRTGELLERQQHECIVQETLERALALEHKKYVNFDERETKMSELQARVHELTKRNLLMKESVAREYVARGDHERMVANLQSQVRGWCSRALGAVDKELAALEKCRRAGPKCEVEPRMQLRLDGVDEQSAALLSKLQVDINDVLESVDMVTGKMGKVRRALHS